MRRVDIGAALDSIDSDVRDTVLDLVRQATTLAEPHKTALMKQALDTPHRARAQINAWVGDYNSRHGAGSAQTFLASCLAAAGSSATLASIDADLATLETQAVTLMNHVRNDAWTWEQVASAIQAQVQPAPSATFNYSQLPIPDGYITIWSEPW